MLGQKAGPSRDKIARQSLVDQSGLLMQTVRRDTTLSAFCEDYLRSRGIDPQPLRERRTPEGYPKVNLVKRAAWGAKLGATAYSIQLHPDEPAGVFEGQGDNSSRRRTDAIAQARAASRIARGLLPKRQAAEAAIAALLAERTDEELDALAAEEEAAANVSLEIEARLAARGGRKPAKARSVDRLAKTTACAYRSYAAIIGEAIGLVRVCDLTAAHVGALHEALGETEGKPTLANRVRVFLSQVLKFAEVKGLRPPGTNPTGAVKPYAEVKREEFIVEEKREAFDAAARDQVSNGTINWQSGFLLLLMFWTGLRWSDAKYLRWSEVKLKGTRDEPHPHLLIADRGPDRPLSKGGKRAIPICAEAIALFKVPRSGGPWVVVNPSTGRPYTEIRGARAKVCEAAGIPDTGYHVYRHTVGAAAGDAGLSTAQIARILGHKFIGSAERYSHVGSRAANDAVGAMSAQLIKRKNAASSGHGGMGERGTESGHRGLRQADRVPGGTATHGASAGAAGLPAATARSDRPDRARADRPGDLGAMAPSGGGKQRGADHGVGADLLLASVTELSAAEARALMASLTERLNRERAEQARA